MSISKERKKMNEMMKILEKNEKKIQSVDIFARYSNGYTIKELSIEFGISESTIRRNIKKYQK